MGRIAPRKKQSSTSISQPLLRLWLQLKSLVQRKHDDQPTLPSRTSRWNQTFIQLWHVPDQFHWMEPLPYFHRRWLLIISTLWLVAVLWPDTPTPAVSHVSATQENQSPLQATLFDNPPATTEGANTENGGAWQNYQVQRGETLAQLFREKQLMMPDLLAMVQIEGDDKPLSNLKAGQQIDIQHDTRGQVSAMRIALPDNRQILFVRQTDNSFRRVQ